MMDKKDLKITLYCSGLFIVLSIWLIVCAAELSAFTILKTALLIILSYTAMLFDIHTKRIPNTLVLIMIVGWLVLIIPVLLSDVSIGIGLLIDSVYGVLIGGGLFLLVYILSKKGLGGGDVKYMAVVGLYLGFLKTTHAILFGTVIAALTGLILISLKKIGRKDTMPLAPFLFIGIMITVFLS